MAPPAANLGGPPGSPRPRGREWSAARTVFRKELLEALRDRRTVIVAIVLPVVMTPIITLGIPYLAHRQQERVQGAPAKVAIRGQAYAADLITFGVRQKLITPVTVSTPEVALAHRDVDAILDVPPSFAAALRAGHASVAVTYDESTTASRLARQRLQELIVSYSVRLTESQLRAHGLDLRDLTPIDLAVRNVADDRKLGGALLASLLPFIICLWAVLGGQNAALDLGVGEKERRTLDALLVVPSPRWTLATGKVLAIGVSSMLAVVVVIATTFVSLRLGVLVGLPELQRSSVAISLTTGAGLLLVAVMLVGFLSSVQLALSFFARSLREAQQYFTPLYLLLVFPAMVAPFLEGWEDSAWTYAVPALNAAFAFRGLLLGTLGRSSLVLTVCTLAACTGVSLAVAVRLLNREAVVYRG